MNQLPSTSRIPNLRDYSSISKILGKKTYVPNLSLSRNVTPKVKVEENVGIKQEEVKKVGSSTLGERPKSRFKKETVIGAETFAPTGDTCRSHLRIKSKPKITNSSSSVFVKKEPSERDELSDRSVTGKFAQISSALPQDLPVSVPRSRSSIPSDADKPISLLMDIFNPSGDESPLFILKTPKYLPGLLADSKNLQASSSKNDVRNEPQKCTMYDVPEGQIGTLQIMKSGRLRLVLGECKFWLHRGVRVNFKEELAYVSANAETKTGEIVNMGEIRHRIIAVPESVTIFADE